MLHQSKSKILTPFPPLLNILTKFLQHLYTLHLFNANDLPTFALPTLLFALTTTLSSHSLITNPSPSILPTLLRIPQTLLLIWTSLLIITIPNQRTTAAVEEDRVNKPHRPLPQGRLSCEDARRLLLGVVPVVVLLGWWSGVGEEVLVLCVLSWMYNDLGGAEEHWVVKNLLVSLGYGAFSSLALRIMTGPDHGITDMGYTWIGIVTGVMFATQHIADLKDAEGDRMRGRKSAVVVMGEEGARWSLAGGVVGSSVACVAFFGGGLGVWCAVLGLGCLVAGRTVVYRSVAADKTTWKLWVLWTCTLFALPLAKDSAVLMRAWEEVREKVCVRGECIGG